MGIGRSNTPTNSLLGMSRCSMAETNHVILGVWGRFLKAPTVFLSLAKSVSFFLQKKEMAQCRSIWASTPTALQGTVLTAAHLLRIE